MGTCTSTARHRRKQQHQQHRRISAQDPLVSNIKPPLLPFPLTAFPSCSYQHTLCLPTDFDKLTLSSSTKLISHPAATNSLIQLYSSNSNNNNNNNNKNKNKNKNSNNNKYNHSWNITNSMSSSSVPQVPARIPVPKIRLATHHPQQSQQTTATIRPKNVVSTTISNDQTGSVRPMSITNRPPPPTSIQTRFGFIPRPIAPGLQQIRTSTLASRSRSISPASIVNVNSSSSLGSHRLTKAQTITKPTPTITANQSIPPSSTTNNSSKPKTLAAPRHRDSSIPRPSAQQTIQASTAASRMRSRTPSRTSTTSSSPSVISSLPASAPSSSSSPSSSSTTTTTTTASNTTAIVKTDVNVIRDRYNIHKRMNFFTHRTSISTANGSPIANSVKMSESLAIKNEKRQSSPITSSSNDAKNRLKAIIPQENLSSHSDSSCTTEKSSTNRSPSAHLSQGNKHRQRATSMLSSVSTLTDILNQDALLEDDNCSLKSDDLMCDYDDTVTIDSSSKNDQIDSSSVASSTNEANKQRTTIIPVTPIKPNILFYQPTSKDRPSTITKYSTTINEKTNANLLESLDELNRLSNQMDHVIDNEQNRLMTRSVSLKPPTSYLPPLEDAEQITMDVESYRQVMKDVMVVKTILHQLDRLLKHSDGTNMTDSIVGSFHEFHDSMFSSRHYSSSNNDGTLRNSTDENPYDDLIREIAVLRKEKEQDKQTIKLLQEQMYKYSSQAN